MVKSEFDDCFQNGNYDALRPYHVDNAIILAAGMCSRFKPLSDTKPKAFLKVKGEILIERMIRQLIEAEIPEIYIVVGHQKEAFSYLAEKYGVCLIENTEYAVRNNLSSIYAARKVLKNSYICCSDLYCMENIFDSYVYESYYAGTFSSKKTDKLCVTTGFNGKISRIRKGGSNCWYMTGPAYWDNQFSARFCELMQKEYDNPSSKDLSWEAFYSSHLDELSLSLRKYPEGIVREFNSLDELCLFDTSYIPYRDSLKVT